MCMTAVGVVFLIWQILIWINGILCCILHQSAVIKKYTRFGSSLQDANNRHLTSAAEQLGYLTQESLFAWKQRTESKAGPGSWEDEDDADVGTLLSAPFLAMAQRHGGHVSCANWEKIFRQIVQRWVSAIRSLFLACVRMHALVCVHGSPRSILRMRGLHCLWPLQPRSSMSWTCIWFRTCRSSVFTALISWKHTQTQHGKTQTAISETI